MKRTNIYLDEKQWEELRKVAYEKRWTISQIIREAIDKHLPQYNEYLQAKEDNIREVAEEVQQAHKEVN